MGAALAYDFTTGLPQNLDMQHRPESVGEDHNYGGDLAPNALRLSSTDPRGSVRIATGSTISPIPARPTQHRPSRAGEDRNNAGVNAAADDESKQHRPSRLVRIATPACP